MLRRPPYSYTPRGIRGKPVCSSSHHLNRALRGKSRSEFLPIQWRLTLVARASLVCASVRKCPLTRVAGARRRLAKCVLQLTRSPCSDPPARVARPRSGRACPSRRERSPGSSPFHSTSLSLCSRPNRQGDREAVGPRAIARRPPRRSRHHSAYRGRAAGPLSAVPASVWRRPTRPSHHRR